MVADKAQVIIVSLIGLLTTLLPLIFLAASGYLAFNVGQKFWFQGEAKNWVLHVRGGELIKKGIGLATWTMPGDQIITFPSQINQVNFKAQQVTAEMQGVEVSGMLIWSVYRDGDGPLNCYKAFGEDLKAAVPRVANGKLENMAVSIVRDRIANLTINDILKNRSKIRNGVKDEMQKILTGWGMWLETCEIQDVKISSSSLFRNLQTEFREKSRQEAEKISAETEQTIKQENLVRTEAYQKLSAESQTKQRIFDSEQKFQVQKQQADIYQKELKITQAKKEAEAKERILDQQRATEFAKKRAELDAQKRINDISIQIKEEQERAKLLLVQQEKESQVQAHELKQAALVKEQELAQEAAIYKMKTQAYTPNVLKAMVLESTERIY